MKKKNSSAFAKNSTLCKYARAFALASILLLGFAAPGLADTKVSVVTDSSGNKHFVIGNREFVPIGVNYLIQHLGAPYQTFDMFDTKNFDAHAVDENLRAIASDGFNVVRLWLKGFDPDKGFDLGVREVGDAYADNVLAVLQMAQHYGLHVILTGAFKKDLWLPKNYLPATPLPDNNSVGGMNRLILFPEMAEAAGQFYHDLLVKIQQKDRSALDTIFYFDLYCELHFDLHQPPFSSNTGWYRFDGRAYDLGNAASRQALMDSAAQSWIRTVGGKVKAVDPHILVTASSFFLASGGHTHFDGGFNTKPGNAQLPYPLKPLAMMRGGANLIDIHMYPSPARPGLTPFHDRVAGIMQADGISAGNPYPLPLMAGEFGLADSKIFRPDDALAELQIERSVICPFHFSGYAVWSWNSKDPSALPANNELAQAVAPQYRPKFCGRIIAP